MFHEPQTINARHTTGAFFVLDSNDRNDANAVLNVVPTTADSQPWNDFRIQKPEPLLNGFAKRIAPVEFRWLWAIPNITPRNNLITISGASMSPFIVNVIPGFYTGAELATAINTYMTFPNPPVFAWNATENVMMITPSALNDNLTISVPGVSTYADYNFGANLAKTMGFSFSQLGQTFSQASPIFGSTTTLTYTNYIDIKSSKMNYNNDLKDGSSARRSSNDLILRIYLGDEISVVNPTNLPGTRPFTIHRQFMTPKYFKLNEQQMMDWIDIQIYDEWNQFVYMPPVSSLRTYPDFQITFVASED
jgi:hypothetical protein